ncbi:hypothetical protein PGT21_032340 [Puccinia graminis f. sp. tritici]|uniref:Flavin reductase like domain-containing protein n=1 Tax=Puccinia graminis f. sp. tritici TaxID=56615 RepID=A0A5B0SFV7_PUCGR|nr:hypothetical protein PGTUg99_004305 [Puccinia graminis f. sp. tritici]KAA1094897.1 hypothetical protein PGT21_032340 [Puccinia graminis f. sp. tritici]KAA1135404.1 hypothetical protein PGTUg99_022441 [Puccinia graminis f. sp. tritici]
MQIGLFKRLTPWPRVRKSSHQPTLGILIPGSHLTKHSVVITRMSHHPPFKQVEASRPDFDSGHLSRYTKTPQPDWQVGQGANNAPLPGAKIYQSPAPTKTFVPYESISPSEMYKLMISSVVPRPIGFCSTLSADGNTNLAPFSYFNAAGSDPPCLMMSFTATSVGGDKDTIANIRTTKEFVIAIISEPFIEAANYTAIDAPSEVSEWLLSGLTPEPSIKVKPARVQEAAVNMECELEYLHEMFDPSNPKKLTQVIVIGRIKAWHIKKDVLVDDTPLVALEKLMPIGRLGGITYSRTIERFELPRPIWKEEKEKDEVKKVLSQPH